MAVNRCRISTCMSLPEGSWTGRRAEGAFSSSGGLPPAISAALRFRSARFPEEVLADRSPPLLVGSLHVQADRLALVAAGEDLAVAESHGCPADRLQGFDATVFGPAGLTRLTADDVAGFGKDDHR